ncbi:MAG: hypothetical protein IPK87_05240 [Planctomycetes bacterium]|nr:hypothetical protein [Planctomycetota bacterium]
MSTFAEYLDLLWQIQALDAASLQAREFMAREDMRASGTERGVDRLMKQRGDADAAYKLMEVRHRELEAELRRLDARIKQIEGVPDSEAAVAKHREAIEALEMDGLNLLGDIDTQRAKVKQLDNEIEAQRKIAAIEREGAKATAREKQEVIDDLHRQREAIAANIPEEVLRVYDNSAQRHPGTAMVRTSTDFCAACSGELNMQLIMRAKARTEFVRCPHCSRILDGPAA